MKVVKYILLLVTFLPLLYFRDFTPSNELRYLSIANEALENGHFFAFTDHGEPYADKPPLYLWLIMLGKVISGEYNMLFLGLFSLIPALCILYIMDKWTRPLLSSPFRLNGQLMLISSGLFAGSAIVLRMDMLMCLFIVLSLYTFYKLYIGQGKPRDKIWLPVYIFLALFSKGPVGILVPLLSITLFLIIQKEIKHFNQYLGKWQWIILLSLCCIWFSCVYAEGGKTYLNNLLFHQTLNRAVQAFHHKEPIYYYLIALWYSLAPWSIFYIATLIAAIRKKAIRTPMEKFFLTIIVSTLVMLSIFSGKLAIYLLPLFPFFAYLTMLLLPKLNEKTLYFSIAIPAILLLFTLPGMYLFIGKSQTELSILSRITVFTLFTAGLISLYFLHKRIIARAINSLASGILIALFIGSFTLPRLNEFIGLAAVCKQAQAVAGEYNIYDFYYYKFRSGEYLDIYLGNHTTPHRADNIEELNRKHNFILFLRNKDIPKNPKLQQLLMDKAIHKVGNYCFIIVDSKQR